MKMLMHYVSVAIFMLFSTLPSSAQNHLVFSKPENQWGIATMMGERILKEAYGKLDITFEFTILPNVRALSTSNKGGTDGEFQRFSGVEKRYPNLIKISVPIGYVDIVVFTKKKIFKINGWQSLKPYSIGFVRGFKLAEARTRGMYVEAVSTPIQVFLMLKADRINVAIESRSIPCRLKKFNMSDIIILEPPVDQLILYHYLHKRHRKLAQKLEIVLTKMKQKGELKLIKKQSMEDFQKLCNHP